MKIKHFILSSITLFALVFSSMALSSVGTFQVSAQKTSAMDMKSFQVVHHAEKSTVDKFLKVKADNPVIHSGDFDLRSAVAKRKLYLDYLSYGALKPKFSYDHTKKHLNRFTARISKRKLNSV